MKGSEFVFDYVQLFYYKCQIMQQLLLMFHMLKKKKYILLIFQNITQIMKKKVIFLVISNGEKCEQSETLATRNKSEGCVAKFEGQQWHYVPV